MHSASTMGAGDTVPVWLSSDMMLNLSSPGFYAMDISKDEAIGTTKGMLESSGRAAMRNVLRLPSLTS